MERTGFNFSVEAGIGDVFGYCEADNKKIVLNAAFKAWYKNKRMVKPV